MVTNVEAYRLRPYRDSDLEPALQLWVDAWQFTYPEIDFRQRLPWWRARWLNEMLPIGDVVMGEDESGRIAGFLVLTPATTYLDQIVVAPPYQGKGLAERLMAYAKRRCTSGLDLHVNQSNARALSFYQRQGFVIATTSSNPRSGLPTYHMRWPGEVGEKPDGFLK